MTDSFRSRLLTKLEHAMDDFSNTITTTSSDQLIVRDVSANTIGVVTLGDLTLADLTALTGAITVGEDGTGHDVIFYSATAGKKFHWDESADTLILAGTVDLDGTLTNGENGTGYDVLFYSATSGKSWLWDESADKMIVTGASDLLGNTQQTGTFTVGVDDTGHDVKFFGATSGKSWLWDESADKVILAGDMDLTGNLALSGSLQNTKTTAVTATATPGPTLTFTGGLNLVSFTTNANDTVSLPTNVAGDIGKEIEIYAVQGFELISADASAKINNVVVGATNELAIVAGTYLKLKCVADNTWLAVNSTLIDGTQTKLVPDALG